MGDITPKRTRDFLQRPSRSVEPLHNRFWIWVLVRVKWRGFRRKARQTKFKVHNKIKVDIKFKVY
jgi:hypothetical protein